ncbi:hypothetical protein A4U61_04150 [Streptomyces sp. H-KF8]|uniref:transposase n=1 Tax=Streptomyces sp. H-KF8 TaxID=1727216 RepID=UPI0007EC79DB|nr:hypothetical protein A4U61_04150 [Streptomyces sp. H-KF8]
MDDAETAADVLGSVDFAVVGPDAPEAARGFGRRRHRPPGRLRVPDRAALADVMHVQLTSVAWRDLPTETVGCSGATARRRLRAADRPTRHPHGASKFFCNWQIDYAYADTSGTTYKTSDDKLHADCNFMTSVYRYNAPRTLSYYGKACAKLKVGDKQRAVQCHSITRRPQAIRSVGRRLP